MNPRRHPGTGHRKETPVTETPTPEQWTRADLDAATARGDHHAITQAQDAGQLAALLTANTPQES